MPEHPLHAPAAVLLVGHCGFDGHRLEQLARRTFPGTQVRSIHRDAELKAPLSSSLLLVNRVLDGRFQAEDGIDLIRRHAAAGGVWTLVSNFSEAQAQAQAAGAQAGFGKAASDESAMAALQAAWRSGKPCAAAGR